MQPIFSRNIDVDKIAFINWRISKYDVIRNLLVLADGFMSSSIELAKICCTDNEDKKADILIFPILANANHGIELYLKAILWTLNRLTNCNNRIEGKHNIKQIFETVKSKIKSYKGQISLKGFNIFTVELQEYIDELFLKISATQKNDKMDFSRYPFNNDYENHFYVDEIGNVEVDLVNFVTRFEIIRQKLENLSDVFFYQELGRE